MKRFIKETNPVIDVGDLEIGKEFEKEISKKR